MASLWKRQHSKFWIACFTDANGRQLKRSTKIKHSNNTTERRLALKITEQFEEAANRRRTARQVREVIAGLHKEITHEDLPVVSVHDFIQGWFERKKHEISPATIAFYKSTAGKFLAYLQTIDQAEMNMEAVTREHITSFRNSLTTTLSARSVNHALKGLRSIFKAARRDGIIQDDPTEFVDTVRQLGNDEQRAFTIEELRAILAVSDAEWRGMIKCGLYLGQRLADIATLTWANVDLARGEMRLTTRKTGKKLILPIAPPLRRHLEGLPSPRQSKVPLHPKAYAVVQQDGRASRLSKQFGELLENAGLRASLPKKSKSQNSASTIGRRRGGVPTFHGLRRTAATLLHEAGIPAAVAQSLIGHDDEATHALYVNVGREAMDRAAASMPDLDVL